MAKQETANMMLVSGDRSKFINITSGTFINIDAAASLSLAGMFA